MITIDNVTKRYGELCALDGVSLTVDREETLGLVGTNGAGKTTLFRMLAGHDRPDEGSIRVGGLPPDAGPELRRRVGFLPENAGFQPSLTGREVLRFYARMRGVAADRRERRVRRVLATVGLDDAADRRVGGYSNGMHRRLGLATVLVCRPDVLLLDEPTAGLDPQGVADFHAIVEGIRDRTDVTVVLSTHDLDEAERLCDRAAVLDAGRIRAVGPVERLRRGDDRVLITASLAGDAGELDDIRDGFPGVSVRAEGDRVRIRCPAGEAMAVLSALHGAADVDRFEVSEPGLAATFHDVVPGDSPDVAPSVTGGDRP